MILGEVYKIMIWIDRMNAQSFTQRWRIKNQMIFEVRGAKFNRNPRHDVFTQRVVGIWNEVPEVVEARTITALKIHLNKYVDRKGLIGIWARHG